MELSQLTNDMLSIFSAADTADFLLKVKDAVLSNDFTKHKQYVDYVDGDLSVDYLQKIFQYHEADRKNKMQDYTPKSLAKAISKLSAFDGEKTCYDMCSGSGALAIQKWLTNKSLAFTCEEYDEKVIPLLLFNLSVRNIEATVVHGDTLSGERFKAWSVRPSVEFSSVAECDIPTSIKTDTCISNPPYNMKWSIPAFAQMQNRFRDCELPPNSNANYAFILTALEAADKVSMILPNGVLGTDNKQEKKIKEYLVNKNLIETVIICPDKMFEATSIPTCIMVFNKVKTNTYIRMIDMRQRYEIEQRKQNGQSGGASHEGRTYIKEFKVFTDEQIKKAIETKTNIPEFSKIVSISDVAGQDYALAPSKYIEFQEREASHREYSDIVGDLNRVIADRNLCKLTMNETIAKSLGMYDLFLDNKKLLEINKAMNECLKFIGIEIIKDDYISMTKNKNEIKFENNSKDKLSTIFLSILQMWKQHIMYLNNEENRYLIELRDALLPDMMSGKINLK